MFYFNVDFLEDSDRLEKDNNESPKQSDGGDVFQELEMLSFSNINLIIQNDSKKIHV